ncbi:MAG: glycoside hydrolase family 2 TIM barrel-domain containing protein [Planctomycetota bacterium]
MFRIVGQLSFVCLVLTLAVALLVPWSEAEVLPKNNKRHQVELRQEAGRWSLVRNGEPYFIRGAGGPGSLKLLAECGGNSTRLWGVDETTKERLDDAHANGISVAIGVWLEHENRGFDYQNFDQVSDQIDLVLKAVNQFKDHPAVLLWGVGNEMEGYQAGGNPAIWSHVEFLASRIKELDPGHPTMTVVAEIGGQRIPAIHKLCPSIDIIGINSYGGAASIPDRYRQMGGTKPYIVTEFGPNGVWDVGNNAIGTIDEPTTNQKCEKYAETYTNLIADSELCLGTYVFYWGQKMEGTATWFGMLSPDGRKTNLVDLMMEFWTGQSPTNKCPVIETLSIRGERVVEGGDVLELELKASDPEGAELKVQWMVLPEADAYITAGDYRPTPKPLNEALVESNLNFAKVIAPKNGGLFRVYAIVDDGTGSVAMGNVSFKVNYPELAKSGKKIDLPYAICDEGDQTSMFVPSKVEGGNDCISMVPTTDGGAKFGESCFRCNADAAKINNRVSWQTTVTDSNNSSAGADLSGAKRLVIWARGSEGDERVTFGIGSDVAADDTTQKSREIKLSKYWKKYYLEFSNADLRRIRTGLWWSVRSENRPVEFYIDRVTIE